jgi:hypothetical protein
VLVGFPCTTPERINNAKGDAESEKIVLRLRRATTYMPMGLRELRVVGVVGAPRGRWGCRSSTWSIDGVVAARVVRGGRSSTWSGL